jgi:hypothetical protein
MLINLVKSNIAKNGYKEEQLVCNNLNSIIELRKIFGADIKPNFRRLIGNSKTDIINSDNITIQIKKFKKGQFGQVDRHWVKNIIENIVELEPIRYILENLCEIPLKKCGKLVDKSVGRIPLSLDNYKQEELDNLIQKMNDNKKKILEYAFYGNSVKPDYYIGVEYIGKIRKKLFIYKTESIINELLKCNFTIKKSKTVIALGNSLTIQRKGGDGGNKSSNQMQFKIIFSLLEIKDGFKYEL